MSPLAEVAPNRPVQHGIWWALIGWVACLVLDALGQLGTQVVLLAGLGDQTLVLDGMFGPGVPLTALLGGLAVLAATTGLQTAVMVGIVWNARPVRPATMGVLTVLAGLLWLILPPMQGGLAAGSAFGVSGLGVDALSRFTMTGAVLGLVRYWTASVPLISALVAVVVRIRSSG